MVFCVARDLPFAKRQVDPSSRNICENTLTPKLRAAEAGCREPIK